jgi:SAM-dependent methyltransferase
MVSISGSPVASAGRTLSIGLEDAHLDENDTLEVELLSPVGGERLGRWRFDGTSGASALTVDWLAPGDEMVRTSDGRTADAFEAGSLCSPCPSMIIAFSSGGEETSIPVTITNSDVLEAYYAGGSRHERYAVQQPFAEAFHRARLRVMDRLFHKYVQAGDRVLDAGSGYSVFFLLGEEWDFEISCADLDRRAVEKMRLLAPGWEWVVADAAILPWDDGHFDVVYAGEVVEHVAEPLPALDEWNRVLRPGGILIISTPNRDRLLSRSTGRIEPVNPEHLREFSAAELRTMLSLSGFRLLRTEGVYLEWLQNWWKPAGERADLLVARFNRPGFEFLFDLSMRMGRLAGSLAYDLVMVCRKT